MFSVSEVLGKAWEDFTEHWVVLVLAIVVTGAVSFAVQFGIGIAGAVTGALIKHPAVPIVIQLAGSLVGMVVNTFMALGGVALFLKAIRHEEPEIGDLFSQGHRLVQGVIAQILVTILMVIAMLPAIIAGVAVGVALKAPEIAILLGVVLMFPAIFLVYALTILAQFFIVDRELDAISAIKASFDAGRTSMLGMLLFFLAMFGLFVAGFLACILPAFFVVAPMLGLAVSHIYERLSPLVEA